MFLYSRFTSQNFYINRDADDEDTMLRRPGKKAATSLEDDEDVELRRPGKKAEIEASPKSGLELYGGKAREEVSEEYKPIAAKPEIPVSAVGDDEDVVLRRPGKGVEIGSPPKSGLELYGGKAREEVSEEYKPIAAGPEKIDEKAEYSDKFLMQLSQEMLAKDAEQGLTGANRNYIPNINDKLDEMVDFLMKLKDAIFSTKVEGRELNEKETKDLAVNMRESMSPNTRPTERDVDRIIIVLVEERIIVQGVGRDDQLSRPSNNVNQLEVREKDLAKPVAQEHYPFVEAVKETLKSMGGPVRSPKDSNTREAAHTVIEDPESRRPSNNVNKPASPTQPENTGEKAEYREKLLMNLGKEMMAKDAEQGLTGANRNYITNINDKLDKMSDFTIILKDAIVQMKVEGKEFNEKDAKDLAHNIRDNMPADKRPTEKDVDRIVNVLKEEKIVKAATVEVNAGKSREPESLNTVGDDEDTQLRRPSKQAAKAPNGVDSLKANNELAGLVSSLQGKTSSASATTGTSAAESTPAKTTAQSKGQGIGG